MDFLVVLVLQSQITVVIGFAYKKFAEEEDFGFETHPGFFRNILGMVGLRESAQKGTRALWHVILTAGSYV